MAAYLEAKYSRVRIVGAASGAVVKEIELYDWKREQETKKLTRTFLIGGAILGIALLFVMARPF